jgi:hypothetical protein
MNADLEALSDAELSETFACEVAGYVRTQRDSDYNFRRPGGGWCNTFPDYATSVDAILPHVGPTIQIMRTVGGLQWNVWIAGVGDVNARTLARSLCIALILTVRHAIECDRARHRSEHPHLGGTEASDYAPGHGEEGI